MSCIESVDAPETRRMAGGGLPARARHASGSTPRWLQNRWSSAATMALRDPVVLAIDDIPARCRIRHPPDRTRSGIPSRSHQWTLAGMSVERCPIERETPPTARRRRAPPRPPPRGRSTAMRRRQRRIRMAGEGGFHFAMVISDWLVTLLTSGSYMHSAETGGTVNLPGVTARAR